MGKVYLVLPCFVLHALCLCAMQSVRVLQALCSNARIHSVIFSVHRVYQ